MRRRISSSESPDVETHGPQRTSIGHLDAATQRLHRCRSCSEQHLACINSSRGSLLTLVEFSAAACVFPKAARGGRQRPNHPALGAIADARIGNPIVLVLDKGQWHLQDSRERDLGRMSKNFSPPPNTQFVSGEVAAILRWRKEDSDEKYYHTFRRDAWETVVPELIFEADDKS
jgi:hypothetical protein